MLSDLNGFHRPGRDSGANWLSKQSEGHLPGKLVAMLVQGRKEPVL